MISRRELFVSAIAASLADAAMAQSKSPKKMTLSIHQNTSRAAGYRKSLEGWAKAGIKFVEITDVLLDEFLKSDTIAAAKRVVTDLGLTPGLVGRRAPRHLDSRRRAPASLETWKRRCEQFATIGLAKIYCPSITNRRVTAEDFKATPGCIREVGDIAKQFNLTAMIEFARTVHASSPHCAHRSPSFARPRTRTCGRCSTSSTSGQGMSKFEDLDMIRPGRDRARALPGHPRYAARADRQQRPRHSWRRQRSGRGDPEKAR
jgi:hypothetical protein